MLELAPTKLRDDLYNTLESVKNGETVCVKTRTERFYILSQKQMDVLIHSSKTEFFAKKLSGKILGNLEESDLALKNYLILPK